MLAGRPTLAALLSRAAHFSRAQKLAETSSCHDASSVRTPDSRFKNVQFQDPSGTLMMLPSDMVLIQASGEITCLADHFSCPALRVMLHSSSAEDRRAVVASFLGPQDDMFKLWVETYAKDKRRFYDDFSASFQKLEELGTKNLKPLPTA